MSTESCTSRNRAIYTRTKFQSYQPGVTNDSVRRDADRCTIVLDVSCDDLKLTDLLLTHLPSYNPIGDVKKANSNADTNLELYRMDTFECAAIMYNLGYRCLVLNFASDFVAGGGWRRDNCIAQEECLCRSSDLGYRLENRDVVRYPWHKNTAVWTPNVHVYANSTSHAIDVPFWCDVISIAAIRQPFHTTFDKYNAADKALMLAKIEAVYRVATITHANCVIAGAFGCGVFGHIPENVAVLFKEVMAKYPMIKTVFAIIDGRRTTNFDVFSKILNAKEAPPPQYE